MGGWVGWRMGGWVSGLADGWVGEWVDEWQGGFLNESMSGFCTYSCLVGRHVSTLVHQKRILMIRDYKGNRQVVQSRRRYVCKDDGMMVNDHSITASQPAFALCVLLGNREGGGGGGGHGW